MKNTKYLYGMSLALILALTSCGHGNLTPSSQTPSIAPSSEPSSEPTSAPTSAPTSIPTSIDSDDDPDISGGTFIDKSKSFKNALTKDYSNMTVYSYQGYDDGEEENYIYYYNDYQIVYDPTSGSYLYYHDYGDSNYLYFSPSYQGGPEAWLDKGYMDAPLSMWNTYFHMPTLLANITDEDVYYISGYYLVKSQEIIDRLMANGFQYAWYNNPTYMWFSLDSDGYINNIVGVDDPDNDESPIFQIKLLNIGNTTFYSATLPTPPNEDNVIPYWQYKGWDGPLEKKYPTALTIGHTKSGEGEFDAILDLEEYDPISYAVTPSDYNTYQYPTWHSTDEKVAKVGYPTRNSNTKSIMGIGEGECEIYATIPGKDKTVVESNRLKIKVNGEKPQHLDGMVYDFSFVDYDSETEVLTALNEAGTLPFSISAHKIQLNDGKNSDYLYSKGQNVLIMRTGEMGEGQPSVTFDFDDQQVSSISFKYGFFWDSDFLNLSRLDGVTIETSNDGTEWNVIDITEEVRDNISSSYLKLMEKSFDPASKVRITSTINYVGRSCRLSFPKVAFMADDKCHAHVDVVPVDTESISLSLNSESIFIGDNAKATAVILPANATNTKVTYSSSNEEVATIDANGNILGLKEGTTTIKATQGSIESNEVTLTVSPRPTLDAKYVGKWISEDFEGYFEVKEDNLSKIYFTLEETAGASKNSFVLDLVEKDGITCNFLDEEGNKAEINFGSDVTLFKKGTNLGGYAPTYNQVDFEKYVASTKIEISAGATTLYLGSSNVSLAKTTLTATVKPTGATASDVTWSVSNPSIVDIEANKNYLTVTAKAVGTVKIFASNDEDIMASITITVSNPINTKSIAIVDKDGNAIPGNALTLDSGAQAKLNALIDEAATERNVTWESSDATIASVSGGTVTAKKAGTATITAKCGSVSASISVTVTGAAAVFHSGVWTGVDYNGTDLTWTVRDDGNAAVLTFTDYDGVDHEYHFTYDAANCDSKNQVFTYDEDTSVVIKMYSLSWTATTSSCSLEIYDENGVINDYETLFIDSNGADMSK